MCMCIYIYTHIFAESLQTIADAYLNIEIKALNHTGVCEKPFLLCQPLSCNLATETALDPLIWCFESPSAQELV